MKRILIATALGVTALGLAAPASAQFGRNDARAYGDPRASYLDVRRIAYENGYREGLKEGQKESRQRDGFGYRDEKTYQRGDKGYHREYGDRERYRQSFRAGYSDGYAEAYRRFGYRDVPGYRGRGVGQGRYGQGGYGPGYGQGGYGYGYGNGAAFQYGLQDGYEKGLEDVRKRRSHDILRHSWYRGGDRHYNSRYGSRQQYADMYRQGFREGYERGFREARYR